MFTGTLWDTAKYANPSSMFKAVELLLRHIGYTKQADKLAAAMDICTRTEKKVVPGKATGQTCGEFADYVMSVIENM